ncbi:MAG: BolA family protein [Thiotrichales bacterium]
MSPDEIEQLINAGMPESQVSVNGDGSKFEAVVISADFAGLGPVKRHQRVYKIVAEQITSGAIHALTIRAFTPDEWLANQARPRDEG